MDPLQAHGGRSGIRAGKRELALSHLAFYSGGRAVLTVLEHMIEHGDSEAAVRTIAQFGRQIKRIHARSARTRGHRTRFRCINP